MKLVRQIGLVAVVLSLSGITGCGDMSGLLGGQGVGGTAPTGGGTIGAGAACSGTATSCSTAQLLTDLNEQRAAEEFSQLKTNASLEPAAAHWAQEMAKCKKHSTTIGGASLLTKAINYGFDANKLSGVIAASANAGDVASSWKRVANERALAHAGLGCAKGDDGQTYWAGIFAKR